MQTDGADDRVREEKAQRRTQCEPPAAEPEPLPSWAFERCGCPSCIMPTIGAGGDDMCAFCLPAGCTGECCCCQASGKFAAPAAGAASAEPSRDAMAALASAARDDWWPTFSIRQECRRHVTTTLPAEMLEVRKPGWKIQGFARRHGL